ncbi:hypothetical protein ACLOAV_005280 [Pseudogymnoascus australis]
MKGPREQKNPPSLSPTSTAYEATTNPSLPKDYKKVVQSLIHRRDISLEVKIDLWKRFAEYEACVDEENHADDLDEPAFTATSVGEIGPDVEMPVPWMESLTRDGSDDGEGEYTGENSDSGYGGNGSNSVNGVEQTEGEETMLAGAPIEGNENSNTAENIVVEEIATTTDTDRGQEKDDDDSKENGTANGNGSPSATPPIAEQEGLISTTTYQEPEAAATTSTLTGATTSTHHPPHPIDHLPHLPPLPPHPTTHATPPTPSPAPRPTTAFAQCRLDIRTYISDLAERERVVSAREKWVTRRAEALWRNAKVVAGMMRREGEGRGRKRVRGMDESEEGRGRKRARRV